MRMANLTDISVSMVESQIFRIQIGHQHPLLFHNMRLNIFRISPEVWAEVFLVFYSQFSSLISDRPVDRVFGLDTEVTENANHALPVRGQERSLASVKKVQDNSHLARLNLNIETD